MLDICHTCEAVVEKFTMSSYRLVAGGPVVGNICAFCANEVSEKELAGLATKQSNHRVVGSHTIKESKHEVCRCPSTEHTIYMDTVDGGEEFPDGLDGLYCMNCNSFWREP